MLEKEVYFDFYEFFYLVPSPPDGQSMIDNDSETKDSRDQVSKT